MPVSHKIQLSYDEYTGIVRLRHFATADIAGVPVTVHEDVPLTKEQVEALGVYLTGLIEPNRDAMNKQATTMGVKHVATVAKSDRIKQLVFDGTLKLEGTKIINPEDYTESDKKD